MKQQCDISPSSYRIISYHIISYHIASHDTITHPILSPSSIVAALRLGKCTEERNSMHTDTPRKSCKSHTQLMCSLYMNHTMHREADIAPIGWHPGVCR